MLAALNDWRLSRYEIRRNIDDLDRCGDREVARLEKDMNIATADLRRMARYRRDAANLLVQRLAALHLDPAVLARREPGLMYDLQRLCSSCGTRRRCGKELAQHPGDPVWQQHCPNADTLVAVQNTVAVRH
jgi:hypothetical protein